MLSVPHRGYQPQVIVHRERETSCDYRNHSVFSVRAYWARRKFIQQMNQEHIGGRGSACHWGYKIVPHKVSPQGIAWERRVGEADGDFSAVR